jgi:hypothetical protein
MLMLVFSVEQGGEVKTGGTDTSADAAGAESSDAGEAESGGTDTSTDSAGAESGDAGGGE